MVINQEYAAAYRSVARYIGVGILSSLLPSIRSLSLSGSFFFFFAIAQNLIEWITFCFIFFRFHIFLESRGKLENKNRKYLDLLGVGKYREIAVSTRVA